MKIRIALAVLGALATMSAQAAGRGSLFDNPPQSNEARQGFYLGFDLGQSSYGLDRGDLDSALADSLQQSGINVLSGSDEVPPDLGLAEAERFELASLAARRVRVEHWRLLRALWAALCVSFWKSGIFRSPKSSSSPASAAPGRN